MGLSPRLTYGVFNNNLKTALKSVTERMLFVKNDRGEFVKPPLPANGHFGATLMPVYKIFKEKVSITSPLTQEQFLGTYEGRKRTIYENAFKSLQVKPFRHSDSYVQWFVKTEKVAFTDSKEPVPRGISPRSPRYRARIGPYIKRIEKEIYEELGELFGGPTVLKGMNSFEVAKQLRAQWETFRRPIAVELDASRMDQHVSQEALRWEHSIYKLYYKDKQFNAMLNMQLTNRCFVNLPEAQFNFILQGLRMSGDMNTSLGNCLLMCAMIYCYCKEQGVRAKLGNNGDDCTLIMEAEDYPKLQGMHGWFLKMGFNMKISAAKHIFEDIEFCQSKPVLINGTYLMVRNPHTSLSKDCVSIHPLNSEKLAKRWCKAVGECGLSLAGGVPVIQDFYHKLYSLGGSVTKMKFDPTMKTGMILMARGMDRKYETPSPETRVSFWRAFGIEPDKQIIMEREFSSRELLLYSHPDSSRVRDFPL